MPPTWLDVLDGELTTHIVCNVMAAPAQQGSPLEPLEARPDHVDCPCLACYHLSPHYLRWGAGGMPIGVGSAQQVDGASEAMRALSLGGGDQWRSRDLGDLLRHVLGAVDRLASVALQGGVTADQLDRARCDFEHAAAFLSASQRQTIMRAAVQLCLDAGMDRDSIARYLEIKADDVAKALYGPASKHHAALDEVRRLLADGLTLREVATSTGIPTQSIAAMSVRHDMPSQIAQRRAVGNGFKVDADVLQRADELSDLTTTLALAELREQFGDRVDVLTAANLNSRRYRQRKRARVAIESV